VKARFGLAALALLSTLLQPARAAVDVVEFINFSCPYCLAMEPQVQDLRREVESRGGKFVVAPLPAKDQASAAASIYYAARAYGVDQADQVKRSLFKGAQDAGQPFEDASQVLVWLIQDLGEAKLNYEYLAEAAESEASKESVARAWRLAYRAGVDTLPAFVLVKDGEPVAIFSREDNSFKPLNIKKEIVNKLNELTELSN
jgi:predicted DsbA family dithiol-disulfide isomerase